MPSITTPVGSFFVIRSPLCERYLVVLPGCGRPKSRLKNRRVFKWSAQNRRVFKRFSQIIRGPWLLLKRIQTVKLLFTPGYGITSLFPRCLNEPEHELSTLFSNVSLQRPSNIATDKPLPLACSIKFKRRPGPRKQPILRVQPVTHSSSAAASRSQTQKLRTSLQSFG